MNKNLTEIVFILDRSGSMSGRETDTSGGYNSCLEKQRKEEGEALISTVLFDTHMKVVHDRVNIKTVRPLTEEDYCVGGCTALLDAMGGGINHIGNIHKYAREEDVPGKTIFVIITDGYENASRMYDYRYVKTMIERQKAKYGWEFIFLGANIDAEAEARRFGIDESRAMNYRADSRGTRKNFDAVESVVAFCRQEVFYEDEIERKAHREKAMRKAKKRIEDENAD